MSLSQERPTDKKISRRRKKRRTEASSDESSSSSSSSEDEQPEENEDTETNGNKSNEDGKPNFDNVTDELNAAIHARLTQIPFDRQIDEDDKIKEDIIDKHSKDRGEMDKKFMQIMTEQFGDQLNELRKDPNFSNKSLMVLAQSIQSSSNIYDDDEINQLIEKD
ncbi:ribosome assembly protein 3 [[Candida] jaroonii]|uniref:Ribosome assembly protein 3 n=1 Tax=[Candida] jaroonii TaxID=467808 RepID=A0ACA9Y7U0_9ASCO|nr:ribosome assembly protein 3 [[Candida] jaroonii]